MSVGIEQFVRLYKSPDEMTKEELEQLENELWKIMRQTYSNFKKYAPFKDTLDDIVKRKSVNDSG